MVQAKAVALTKAIFGASRLQGVSGSETDGAGGIPSETEKDVSGSFTGGELGWGCLVLWNSILLAAQSINGL